MGKKKEFLMIKRLQGEDPGTLERKLSSSLFFENANPAPAHRPRPPPGRLLLLLLLLDASPW